MQHVAVDRAVTSGDGSAVAIQVGDAVKAALAAPGQEIRSLRSLADALSASWKPIDDSTLSRTLRGQHPLTVDLVLAIEASLGMERGELLIQAGLVALPSSAAQAIRSDPNLSSADRATVLRVYDALLSSQADGSTAKARTARRTDRS